MNDKLIKTPIGRVVFGHPTRKDNYDKYSLGVEFELETVKDILQQLKAMQDAFLMLNKNLKPARFWSYAKNENGDEVKDKVVLVFKSGFPAKVYDSTNRVVEAELNMGRDSRIMLVFKPMPQEAKGEAHIARYMQAVKVIDFVEYVTNPFGDDLQEGSFVVNDNPKPEVHNTAPTAAKPDAPFDDEMPF